MRIWANMSHGKGSRFGWHYIDIEVLDKIPAVLLNSRKVMLDKKGHAITSGKGNVINNIPQIVEKNEIASGDVLFALPEYDTDYDLDLIRSLFITKTARFLMTITQKDLYVRGFENIPDYAVFKEKLAGELFTDDWFYKEYNFSQQLIDHIESTVSAK